MFGVKTEEPETLPPGKPTSPAGTPKKVFFGVEVEDENPQPSATFLEQSETTSPEIVLTRKKSRTAVVVLGLALGAALSVAVAKSAELSSARHAVRTSTTRANEAQAQVETLTARVTAADARAKALEADKAKLTQSLTEKTLALEALQKKGAKAKSQAHAKKATKPHRAKVSLR